jgi:hypothetical protein
MTKRVAVVGSVVALTTLGTWLGFVLGQRSNRYETKVAGEGLYKIDRQTGVVEFCFGVRCGVASSNQSAKSAKAQPGKVGNARQDEYTGVLLKRNIEDRQRFEFLLMLEEGFISPDGKWTDKARRAYQADTQPGTIERLYWGANVVDQIRDRRLAAFGANPSTFALPDPDTWPEKQ